MAKIAYVEHPVAPEQKAELRAQGLRIVDARFAPEGAEIYGKSAEPRTHAAPDPEMDRLRVQAESYGIEVDGRWSADTLREKIAQHLETATVPESPVEPQEA